MIIQNLRLVVVSNAYRIFKSKKIKHSLIY